MSNILKGILNEGAYQDGVRDGMQGEANPRASSIYGPESGEYQRGYEDGLVKGKDQKQANIDSYNAKLAPYKDIPTEELKQMLRDIRKRSDEIQAIYDKYRGASLHGGKLPPNSEELRAEGKKNNEAWNTIHQVLFQRGVPNDQRLEEADEWEEEGDKFQRFLAYAQKQLEAADPAQRIPLARRLSVWQVKHFGPENNQSYNPNTGAAIQGNSDITPSIRAILEIINRPSGQTFSSTVASIPSPQQVEIDNSWRLTDEGKQWLAYAKEELQKAGVNSSDFMEVARALSQQQVKKFGRASMDTRNNITAEISMIIDKIRWLGVVASQQANQEMFTADMTVNELIDNYNDASPQEQATFRAGVERDYNMSVQEFFDYLQEHDQLPQARKQPEDALAEVKKANTKTARKELSKKPKAKLSDKEKETKQSEEDKLWAMLQQHIADAEKNKDVKEANQFFKPGPQTTGKFPEPRKPKFQGDQGSKSETLGRDGLIYHWQDPRAKQSVAEGQEVDVSVVVGKLYDIIDHAENEIKNADYDRQVQYATSVRDRAVKALEMIKQGGNTPEAASSAFRYFQSGEQGVTEAGNKPLEKSRISTGDTRTPRELKTQMQGASDEFVRSVADKKTGPFHSKVAKMQGKLAKSELRHREQGVMENTTTGILKGINESKKMSAAEKLQRAFQKEQEKSQREREVGQRYMNSLSPKKDDKKEKTSESFGNNYPQTYEEENDPFKTKGNQRPTDLTT